MIGEQSRINKVAAFATNRKEQKRFIKFAIVGAIGMVVDLIVFNILHFGVGISEEWANPVSVSCAIISNFTWNRLWSFPESRRKALVPQFLRFAGINIAGLLLNQVIFLSVLRYVMPQLHIPSPFDVNLAKIAAIGVVLFWNFGINRLTTYRGL